MRWRCGSIRRPRPTGRRRRSRLTSCNTTANRDLAAAGRPRLEPLQGVWMTSKKSTFQAAGQEQRTSTISEFIFFLKTNKKWWLVPILVVISLLALLSFLAGTGVAPFIYPL